MNNKGCFALLMGIFFVLLFFSEALYFTDPSLLVTGKLDHVHPH